MSARVAIALMLVQVVPCMAAGEAAPMERLGALVGVWEGGGTFRRGPGEPTPFVGREVVEARLDGKIVTVEGTHWTSDRSRMVHHAFAVFSPGADGEYRFQTWLASGPGGDYRAWWDGEDLVWEIPTEAGRIRYFIRIEGDEWREIGRIERGGAWRDFFEMTLKRVR
ncbi:MAG: hypothetical protein ACRD2J_15400 [Thermoanaerobaculia bacterium]